MTDIEQLKESWRREYGAIFGRQYTIQFDYKPPLPDKLEARWSRLCNRYASKHPQLETPGIYFFFAQGD